MARFREEAYVLVRFPYRERDLVVALLTRGQGLLRALVRGARGARNMRASALEPLCHLTVEGFQRAGAELATVHEYAMLSSSFPLASRPEAWAAGQVLAELALLHCPPGQRSEPSFRLVNRCAQALLGNTDPVLVAHYAELWFLRLAGVFPDLDRCGRCQEELAAGPAWFDAPEGCLLCRQHRPSGSAIRLDPTDLRWLRSASTAPVERLGRPAPDAAAGWLATLRSTFTGREVASWELLRHLVSRTSGMGPG